KGGIRVHDWEKWQEPKDRTNAKRQAAYKQRVAEKKKSSTKELPDSETETEERRGRIDTSVIATALPDVVTVLPPEQLPPCPPISWTENQMHCINQARDMWGASNGDTFVGEMLRIYE